MTTINHLQGYAFAKKKGDRIDVFEGPHTLADFMPVIAEGTDVPRMLKDRFADVVTVKDFGAKGDGATDDTDAIQNALNFAAANTKAVVVFPAGSYVCEGRIDVQGTGELVINAWGAEIISKCATPLTDGASTTLLDYAVKFSGVQKRHNGNVYTKYPQAIAAGSMTLQNVWGDDIESGDVIHISTTQLLDTDYRTKWSEGFIACVDRVEGDIVKVKDVLPISVQQERTATCAVTSVNSATSLVLDLDEERENARLWCRNASGEENYISDWDNTTKVATFTKEWSNAQVGEAITLFVVNQSEFFKPITVIINGLKITRDKQTNASDGDLGFRGLYINAGAYCQLNDCSITNFSECNAFLNLCYKSIVSGGDYSYANRMYLNNGSTDGTGYGVLLSGCSYCVTELATFVGNRCSYTTAHNSCRSVENVFRGNRIYTPNGLTYAGDICAPDEPVTLNSLNPSGFGDHGCGLRNVFSDNYVFNVPRACVLMGEEPRVLNNIFVGSIRKAIHVQYVKGADISGNKFYPEKSLAQTGLIQLYGYLYNQRKPLVIRNNESFDSATGIVSVSVGSLVNPVISNLRILNNYVRFSTAAGVKSGICYDGKTTDFTLENVVINGNKVEYNPSIQSTQKYGFSGALYCWSLKENSYIEVDTDLYMVSVSDSGSVTIPLKSREYGHRKIDVVCITDGVYSIAGVLFGVGYDYNPATKEFTSIDNATSSSNKIIVIPTSKVPNISDSLAKLYLHSSSSREITVLNKSNKALQLFIRIEAVS